MKPLYFLLQLLLLVAAGHGCRVTGGINDLQSSFSDLAAPTTLTIQYTYTWITTDIPCGTLDAFTDLQTIVAGGSSWYALPAIISSTPGAGPITYTHQFPDLTMTDLQSLGPAIYWIATWEGEFEGAWSEVVFIPYPTPAPTVVVEPSYVAVTYTATTTPPTPEAQNSNSLAPGTIAGIVVGVLVALLAFVGACFFFIRRKAIQSSKRRNSNVTEPDRKFTFKPSTGEFPRRPESAHSSIYYPEMELNEMGRVLVR